MTELVWIGIGAALNILAILLLFKDCYRAYGSTMGGEMLAGLLWLAGSALLVTGVYLASSQSVLWGAISLICLSLAGLVCHQAAVWLGRRYGKPSPVRRSSGFAKHIERENDLRHKQ